VRYAATWLAGVVAIAGCSAAPRFTAAHQRAERDSVAQVLDQWRNALDAGDFARAATFYSTDSAFRWFQDGELRYRSAAELGDTMRAMAPALRSFSLSLIEPEITAIAPGVVLVTTNFAQKMTDTSGETIGLAGAISMTVVHGNAGWRFLVGHTSSVILPVDSAAGGKRRKS
jgi:ketosteroid isomerase-like protein